MSAVHAAQAPAGPPAPEPPRTFHDIPGWFFNTDLVLFAWLLERQRREDQRGDLLEMGAYLGKSAVFMGGYLRPGETFTVCDLFGTEAPDSSNGSEVRGSYATLTRRAFEANYLSFHAELPRVVQAPTSTVPDVVEAGSCRFVHVDASHLYRHVRGDIAVAREVLGEDGIVVLDDFRSEHTPGVACATWQAVADGGLRPVCISPHKFYGTWGDPGPVQEELVAALEERGDCWLGRQEVAGHPLVIVGGRKAKQPKPPAPRHPRPPAREGAGEAAEGPDKAAERPGAPRTAEGPDKAAEKPGAPRTAEKPGTPRTRRPAWRRLAVDVLPPVLTRALRRARGARRAGGAARRS